MMADIYADVRRIYINVPIMNDTEEEYEEELRNSVEELKKE